MSDLLRDLIVIGKGFVSTVDEALERLVEEGEKRSKGIPSREDLENMLVERSVRVLRDGIEKVEKGWKKAEEILIERLARLVERLDVATNERVDVVERISLNTREMVEDLRRRIEELEKRQGAKE